MYTIEDCDKRWTVIWNRYTKERAKIPASGSGAEVNVNWPPFKYLRFLDKVVKKRKTFGNVSSNTNAVVVDNVKEEDDFIVNPITGILSAVLVFNISYLFKYLNSLCRTEFVITHYCCAGVVLPRPVSTSPDNDTPVNEHTQVSSNVKSIGSSCTQSTEASTSKLSFV